jgi:hypothetical protein
MKKRSHLKALFIILTVILILFSYGCSKKPEDYPITDKDFKKGTSGIELEFIQSAPPDKVLEESYFQAATRLYNRGAYNSNNVYVTAGIEQDYMCVTPTIKSVVEKESPCVVYSENYKQAIDKLRVYDEQLSPEENTLNDLKGQLIIEEAKKLPNVPNVDRISSLKQQIAEAQVKVDALRNEIATTSATLVPVDQYLSQNKGSLIGKSIANPSGDIKESVFNLFAKKIDAQSKVHTSTIAMTACYEYYTEFSDDVCIDADVYKANALNKVCTVSDLLSSGGQGAPIMINRIETKMLPVNADKVKPQFVIYIKNVGTGNVISANKVKEACSARGVTRTDWNSVELSTMRINYKNYKYDYIEGKESSDNQFECKKQPIKLYTNEGQIVCTLKDDNNAISKTEPAFKTQIYVRLRYGYMFSKSKDVVIEKPVKY